MLSPHLFYQGADIATVLWRKFREHAKPTYIILKFKNLHKSVLSVYSNYFDIPPQSNNKQQLDLTKTQGLRKSP